MASTTAETASNAKTHVDFLGESKACGRFLFVVVFFGSKKNLVAKDANRAARTING